MSAPTDRGPRTARRDTCETCGIRLNWREKHDGKCGVCNGNDGPAPYPTFRLHPDRCAGLGSCPRDYSCVE